ncbi:hypothetical protein LTR53_006196 [Teratosphaeriaceae sp. CCFEE 6253]|nr:hypothetical protein LTR53_006196 [Teratosphaeriaceae sp. CCFEE 6253]
MSPEAITGKAHLALVATCTHNGIETPCTSWTDRAHDARDLLHATETVNEVDTQSSELSTELDNTAQEFGSNWLAGDISKIERATTLNMQTPSPFAIRPATIATSDHELFVDFQESQIKWLSTVGSSDQWGTKSIRQKNPQVSDRTRAWIVRSERRASWGSDWCRAFVAEASSGTPAAGMVLESKSNAYVRDILPEQDDSDPFVYLACLISNRNAGGEGRGAGAALIAFAKQQARGAGVERVCVDCWRGNDRKLVK